MRLELPHPHYVALVAGRARKTLANREYFALFLLCPTNCSKRPAVRLWPLPWGRNGRLTSPSIQQSGTI